MDRSPFLRDSLCVFFLGAAAAALLWRPMFLGEAFVGADHLRVQYPWALDAPRTTRPLNLDVSDGLQQFYPYRLRLHRALREGKLPLWDPDAFCGTPFAAGDYPAVFYPLNLVVYRFFHPDAALGWMAFLHVWLAGAGMFALLRTLGGTRTGGLVSGLSFMFSGFLVVRLQFTPMAECLAWLPALLALLETALRRDGMFYYVVFAAAWAFQITAGYLQGSVYIALVLAAWFLYRVVAMRRPGVVLKGAAAAAVAAALSMPHWLPVVELALLSQRETIQAHVTGFQVKSYPVSHFVTALLPDVFGNPLRNDYRGYLNYAETSFYTGAAAVFLALVSFFRRGERGFLSFFRWFLVLAVLFAVGSPLYLVFHSAIPFFKGIQPHRSIVLVGFAVAVLAGLSWSHIEKDAGGGRSGARISAAVLASGAVILAALCFVYLISARLTGAHGEKVLIVTLGDFAKAASVAAVACIIMTAVKSAPARNFLIVVLVAADVFPPALRFNPSVPRNAVFPPHPSITYLQSRGGLYRITAQSVSEWILFPNSAGVYGLQDVRGFASLYQKRYQDLVHAVQARYSAERFPGGGIVDFTVNRAPVLDFMNLAYLMTLSPVESFDWERVYGNGVYVYYNRRVLPRVTAAPSYVKFDDESRLLSAVVGPEFNPRRAVYLSLDPADPAFVGIRLDGRRAVAPPFEGVVEVLDYGAGYYRIRARFSRRGFIVVSESHYPGWEASVDGRPGEVMRANYNFIAVPVEGGGHVVELAFRPRTVRIGLASAFCALCLVVALAASGFVFRSRRLKV
ncbi:MAG: YfhO family protein [bacterium]